MNYGVDTLITVCALALTFFFVFLFALLRDMSRISRLSADSAEDRCGREGPVPIRHKRGGPGRRKKHIWAAAVAIAACAASLHAQSTASSQSTSTSESPQAMQERITKLEDEVSELKSMVKQLQSTSAQPAGTPQSDTGADTKAAPEQSTLVQSDDRKILDFLHGTTIDVGLDTYYEYNFNHPVGRVNLLRAYDVLSNNFNLNQASAIFDHPPDVAAGRRWGGRLDLQFGQATDTLQGNPSNEPHPDIYRNIFQAYGTYIVPVGKGLNVDFGKWGSSLGVEGNYTKDQMNYSRSYWFNFLPFYHMGFRTSYPVNDRFALNYWLINGTNQVEATNGFKDELFGFTAKPVKNLTWTVNYYLGQDHPDRAAASNCGPIPVQPGLCFTAIRPAPDGRTHIFDSYSTWQATAKLTLQVEGDYVIQRLWRDAAPGQSSAPSVVKGGAGYARYQFNPKFALAGRAECLSDGGGLFSDLNQALKEPTVTFDYNLGNGFLTRYEWRRDFSNQPSFLTDVQGVLSKEQNTATVGLIWWWGRKQGAW
jgi:hypothetical protein